MMYITPFKINQAFDLIFCFWAWVFSGKRQKIWRYKERFLFYLKGDA